MKEINTNLILNLIRSLGPVARTELARRSGLSLATISGLTSELIEQGLVHEMGEGESTGGRRPALLRLNHAAGYVVGVKLMEHAITSAITDLDARVVHYRVTPLAGDVAPSTRTLPTPETVIQQTIEAIENTIAESGVGRERLFGIGVGMAGVVDSQRGLCHYSPFFDWHDIPFAAPLAAHFDLPVYLENDVDTLTIAEQWFGYGDGVEHFVVVTVGRGVGAGLVLNGQFYRGALGAAGEFGHLTLAPDGPLCSCGKRGCLEALASDPAVVGQAEAAVQRGEPTLLAAAEILTLETIVAAAEVGDVVARRLLAESGHWLGIGIANVVNLLNPQLIVLSGEGLLAGRWRLEPLRAALRAHVFNGLADELEFVVEPLGDEAWARGAACVVLGELFRSPVGASKIVDWKVATP